MSDLRETIIRVIRDRTALEESALHLADAIIAAVFKDDGTNAEIAALRERLAAAERERDEQRGIAYSLAMGCPDCGGVGTVPVHNDGDDFDAEKDCPNGVTRSIADTGDYEWLCGCVESLCPSMCSAGQAADHLRKLTSRAETAEATVAALAAVVRAAKEFQERRGVANRYIMRVGEFAGQDWKPKRHFEFCDASERAGKSLDAALSSMTPEQRRAAGIE